MYCLPSAVLRRKSAKLDTFASLPFGPPESSRGSSRDSIIVGPVLLGSPIHGRGPGRLAGVHVAVPDGRPSPGDADDLADGGVGAGPAGADSVATGVPVSDAVADANDSAAPGTDGGDLDDLPAASTALDRASSGPDNGVVLGDNSGTEPPLDGTGENL